MPPHDVWCGRTEVHMCLGRACGACMHRATPCVCVAFEGCVLWGSVWEQSAQMPHTSYFTVMMSLEVVIRAPQRAKTKSPECFIKVTFVRPK